MFNDTVTGQDEAMTTAGGARPAVNAGAHTAVGLHRELNEDALTCGPTWFAVADGMGGRRAGELASRTAVEALADCGVPRSIGDVRQAVARANSEVHRISSTVDDARGMGTTLVGIVAAGDAPDAAPVLFHVGDSRCYRLHRGTLSLLTRDHSHVQELIDAGLIDRTDAGSHRLRHVVTRALGVDDPVEPDISVLPTPAGRLLLCSDGLAGALSPRAIGRVLTAVSEPAVAARHLVELAARRSSDNVTAIVMDTMLDMAIDPVVDAVVDAVDHAA